MRETALILLSIVVSVALWSVSLRQPPSGVYPSQPIDILVGYSAGGGTDVLTRRLARNMEATLRTPVNIVNKPGGGGLVAVQELAAQPADGYTLGVLLGNQFLQKHFQGADAWIDPLQDVTLLGVFNRDVWGVAVQDGAPYESVAEFLAHARDNPGLRVEADALVQSGLIKMIGVAAEDRLAAYPDLPTFAEHGWQLVIGPWRSIVGPPGMPEDVRDILQAAVRNAYESPDFRTFLETRGFGRFYYGPIEGAEFFQQEDQFFKRLMERRGQARGQ